MQEWIEAEQHVIQVMGFGRRLSSHYISDPSSRVHGLWPLLSAAATLYTAAPQLRGCRAAVQADALAKESVHVVFDRKLLGQDR